jgi:predicted alpha/beta hydrolase family esterase
MSFPRGFRDNRVGQSSRYGNTKVTVDGIQFDSRIEAHRYGQLLVLQRAGQIRNLQVHPKYVLAPAVVLDGRTKPELRYFGDFAYEEGPDWQLVVEDTKNPFSATKDAFRIKRHLMKSVYDIEVRCVTS